MLHRSETTRPPPGNRATTIGGLALIVLIPALLHYRPSIRSIPRLVDRAKVEVAKRAVAYAGAGGFLLTSEEVVPYSPAFADLLARRTDELIQVLGEDATKARTMAWLLMFGLTQRLLVVLPLPFAFAVGVYAWRRHRFWRTHLRAPPRRHVWRWVDRVETSVSGGRRPRAHHYDLGPLPLIRAASRIRIPRAYRRERHGLTPLARCLLRVYSAYPKTPPDVVGIRGNQTLFEHVLEGSLRARKVARAKGLARKEEEEFAREGTALLTKKMRAAAIRAKPVGPDGTRPELTREEKDRITEEAAAVVAPIAARKGERIAQQRAELILLAHDLGKVLAYTKVKGRWRKGPKPHACLSAWMLWRIREFHKLDPDLREALLVVTRHHHDKHLPKHLLARDLDATAAPSLTEAMRDVLEFGDGEATGAAKHTIPEAALKELPKHLPTAVAAALGRHNVNGHRRDESPQGFYYPDDDLLVLPEGEFRERVLQELAKSDAALASDLGSATGRTRGRVHKALPPIADVLRESEALIEEPLPGVGNHLLWEVTIGRSDWKGCLLVRPSALELDEEVLGRWGQTSYEHKVRKPTPTGEEKAAAAASVDDTISEDARRHAPKHLPHAILAALEALNVNGHREEEPRQGVYYPTEDLLVVPENQLRERALAELATAQSRLAEDLGCRVPRVEGRLHKALAPIADVLRSKSALVEDPSDEHEPNLLWFVKVGREKLAGCLLIRAAALGVPEGTRKRWGPQETPYRVLKPTLGEGATTLVQIERDGSAGRDAGAAASAHEDEITMAKAEGIDPLQESEVTEDSLAAALEALEALPADDAVRDALCQRADTLGLPGLRELALPALVVEISERAQALGDDSLSSCLRGKNSRELLEIPSTDVAAALATVAHRSGQSSEDCVRSLLAQCAGAAAHGAS